MKITFISDYVCPYCLVAKEALRQALKNLGLQAEIEFLPFELTPEPLERVDTWSDEKRREGYRVLEAPCAELGLPMKLPPQVVPRPYTRPAFEGWFYAAEQGAGDAYNDAVYRAYFMEEKDIGEPEVLAAIAESVGLDRADFLAALASGRYTAAEKAAVQQTIETYHPKYVPYIFVDGERLRIKNYTLTEMIALLTARTEG